MTPHDASMRFARDSIGLATLANGALVGAALLVLFAALWGAPVRAERAERDRPTYIESDRLHYDETKQTTEFFGRVVLTRGTLIIRGDHMLLRQFGENEQTATARGKPASFRQKRDGPGEQFVDGTASLLDYDSRTEKLTLTGSAVLTRTECGRQMDQISGAVIVYDGRQETFSVDGGAATGRPSAASSGAAPGSGPQASGSGQPGGRVRVTIQPRPESKSGSGQGASTANPCPPSDPTRLKTDPRIGP
jgi:lipopolysaccharide export system protein LptA